MRRFRVVAALALAALAGYSVGSLRHPRVAEAAKDQAKELLALDREFDAATSRSGSEAWVSYFADDGVMMPAGRDLVVGKPAVREYVTKSFSTPGFSLRWEPVDGAASGDIGYTYGVWKAFNRGGDGKTSATYGKYATIWRRQPDRTWKIAVDIGNASPAPAPKP